MRSVARLGFLLLAAAALRAAPVPYFAVLGRHPGAWQAILSSIGLEQRDPSSAGIFVARAGTPASPEWTARVEQGAIVILEGQSALAEMFGLRPGKTSARITSVMDIHNPGTPAVWENAAELPVFDLPRGGQVFASDRWSRAPVLAGLRRGAGAILWVAADPGERGYERYPYLLQALWDLGLEPPFRSTRLWAFFDSAYRARVDLDYLTARWARTGITGVYVAAWHFFEPDNAQDAYLKHLIEACHREGILVYAWFELPHVSEKFWNDHPEWREKTAVLQDAQLDWRKLMNITNRDCFRAVSEGVQKLIGRFGWDGVNLAELYFESLQGIGVPSRFTPMNKDVRSAFHQQSGFDPIELFGSRQDAASRQAFLDFRASLAHQMQTDWIGELESIQKSKPYLDLVLTHVDDRLDTKMRDAVGADTRRVVPLLDTHQVTLLIEDPATVWSLGPERYQAMAESYRAITSHADRLAIDLNIVERYQNVYPTKQQTGTELFQLLHRAAASIPQIALYFEASLLPCDLTLLSAASAPVIRSEKNGKQLRVESSQSIGVSWKGPAVVDGKQWPAFDSDTVWLPPGTHTIQSGSALPGLRLLKLTGDLLSARSTGAAAVALIYRSNSRAIAVVDRVPRRLEIDGAAAPLVLCGPKTVLLPRGEHEVTLAVE